jgi:hypothetical protein
MIIIDFDIVGVASFPYKADPPLFIYPNAVLSRAFSFQGFKMKTRACRTLSARRATNISRSTKERGDCRGSCPHAQSQMRLRQPPLHRIRLVDLPGGSGGS